MIDTTPSTASTIAATPTARNGQEVTLQAKEKEDSFDNLVEEFLKWSKMNPAERIRAQYLKEHGLTEESLAALPEEKREAIEKEIEELIEDKMALGDDTEQELEQMEQIQTGEKALQTLLSMQSILLDRQEASPK
ncbi:hypothetical protein [Emcibacter sp.]|uniref:hypothetical protein n=1 Tax=Emcibacter sp. TaxID=1979954 RepID=UPI003A94885C